MPNVSINTDQEIRSTTVLDANLLQIAQVAIVEHGCVSSALDRLGFNSLPDAHKAIAHSLGMETVDLTKAKVNGAAADGFPVRLIHRYGLFPIDREDSTLTIATANPFDLNSFDDVANSMGVHVIPVLAETLLVVSRNP